MPNCLKASLAGNGKKGRPPGESRLSPFLLRHTWARNGFFGGAVGGGDTVNKGSYVIKKGSTLPPCPCIVRPPHYSPPFKLFPFDSSLVAA